MQKKHIPNLITASRGLGILVISVLFWVQIPHFALWSLGVFLLSALTDFWDGYLSRKWNAVSDIGIVFDSLLDKLLILSLFFLLSPFDAMPAVLFLLLFWREILVDGMKNFLLSRGKPISAMFWGKVKMVLQIFFLITCLLFLEYPSEILEKSMWFWGILTLVVSGGSAFPYAKTFFLTVSQK